MEGLLYPVLDRMITRGSLEIVSADGRSRRFGDGSGPPLTIRFVDPSVARDMVVRPDLKVPEAFMEGRFTLEGGTVRDLVLLLSTQVTADQYHWLARAMRGVDRSLRRLQQYNPSALAKRRVQHHYDIGDDLYRLFLDADWQYSCAYFERPDASLEEAQLAKKRHIAAKLALFPGARVLDIGCGWGGMALYLSAVADAAVTGVTLAEDQHRVAVERARRRGLADRVDIRLSDYRHVTNRFDRIVSVGMFEHVGVVHYDEFFRRCRKLLADDGVMLLHTIGRLDGPGVTNPFIRKYIFPGGYIPALSEIMPAVECSGLYLTDVEVLRLHYAETLRHWYERFMANRAEAAERYGERFCRMWEFYLAGSEAVFRTGEMVVFQLQLTAGLEAVPLTRTYMVEEEERLRAREREVGVAPEPAPNLPPAVAATAPSPTAAHDTDQARATAAE